MSNNPQHGEVWRWKNPPSQLILLRGLPGSGKSTFAQMLKSISQGELLHYEADMYFMTNGMYNYKPELISEAHQWCLQATSNALMNGLSVVVSNTFTRRMELQPYINIAERYKAQVTVLHVEGNYGSIHNVPDETLRKMAARWEPYAKGKPSA